MTSPKGCERLHWEANPEQAGRLPTADLRPASNGSATHRRRRFSSGVRYWREDLHRGGQHQETDFQVTTLVLKTESPVLRLVRGFLLFRN